MLISGRRPFASSYIREIQSEIIYFLELIGKRLKFRMKLRTGVTEPRFFLAPMIGYARIFLVNRCICVSGR